MQPSPLQKKFVVLTTPRSGSNMLCTLLNSHPEILCHHEIFNESGIKYALHLRDTSFSIGTVDERDRDAVSFVSRVWQHSAGYQCVGFKVNNYQNEPVLRNLLGDRTVQKIVLQRRNQVKAYVSWLIAFQLKQWEVYEGQPLSKPRPKVNVNVKRLMENIRGADAFYQDVIESLNASRQAYLKLIYEELIEDKERMRLLEFLDVDPCIHRLQVSSVKQNSNDLRHCIENFPQLASSLQDSPLLQQLYECRS